VTTRPAADTGPSAASETADHGDAFTLPASPASVSEARHRLCRHLSVTPSTLPLRDDATLVLSELVTNALIHTDSAQITCHFHTTARTLYLAVTDHGNASTTPHLPDHTNHPETPEHGRGLLLVDTLAHTWGTTSHPHDGHTVWALLTADEDSCRGA
jgi:anti-sigma regulatory factor (Ser/Thr protein kinase)